MAKTFTNKIFQIDWTDATAGWDYRLKIYPSDTTPQTTPTTVNIPPNVIHEWQIEWGFPNDEPSGVMAKELNITFGLEETNDTDFNRCISFPLVEYFCDIDVTASSGTYTPQSEIIAGNYCELFIKFNGVETPATYHCVYRGVQKNGVDDATSVKTWQLKVTFEHLGTAILQNISTQLQLKNWLRLSDVSQDLIEKFGNFDALAYSGGYRLAAWVTQTVNDADLKYGWYQRLLEIIIGLNWFVKSISYSLTRGVLATTYVELFFPDNATYHKQTYNTTGAKGADITDLTSLYVLGWLSDSEVADKLTAGNDFYGGFWHDLEQQYNVLYDFWQDLFQSYQQKCYFLDTDDGLFMYPLDMERDTVQTRKDLDIAIFDQFNTTRYKPKVNAAPIITNGDDIASTEVIRGVSRSKEGRTVPITFGNSPSTQFVNKKESALHWVISDLSGGQDDALIALSQNVKSFNLLYYDTPTESATDITDSDAFILVHDNITYRISPTLDTDDLYTQSIISNDAYTERIKGQALVIQQGSTSQKVIAEAFSKYYGVFNRAFIDCEIPQNELIDFSTITLTSKIGGLSLTDVPYGAAALGWGRLFTVRYTLPTPENDANCFDDYVNEFTIVGGSFGEKDGVITSRVKLLSCYQATT